MIIDIHCHMLHRVDDGSPSLEASLSMLDLAKNAGVEAVICTPHFRNVSFMTPKAVIEEKFLELKKNAPKDIQLFLGQEIAYGKNTISKIKSGELLTLNASPYVLLEFDYNNFVDIEEVVYDLSVVGYKPIIAHIERYEYVNSAVAEELKECGAMIQVNADSFLQGIFSPYRKRVDKLVKLGLVDFVASDAHSSRKYLLSESYRYVSKKYGKEVCDKLFYSNAKKIIT